MQTEVSYLYTSSSIISDDHVEYLIVHIPYSIVTVVHYLYLHPDLDLSCPVHHIRAVVHDCNASVNSFELSRVVHPTEKKNWCGDTNRPQQIRHHQCGDSDRG
jgi:hypothetical protein